MQLPFTAEQFITVFETYNAAIGPLPLIAYLLEAGAVYLTFKPTDWSDRVIALIMAAFWAFTGGAYHLVSFAAINPAARVFGAAFVVQAALLVWGAFRSDLTFGYRGSLKSIVGLGIVAWSMLGYPLAGALFGHGYPAGPVFALTPCPLLLFTFGMFLLAERTPTRLVIIPMLWALVGTTAAFALGIREDLTLALSAITFLTFQFGSTRSRRTSSVSNNHSARTSLPNPLSPR